MIFKWETKKERLLKQMQIPPKEKLEWLQQMNKFLDKYTPKDAKLIREKLRKG